jgi:protein-S-isoprenylcysteine O-methyltransferase Ste14
MEYRMARTGGWKRAQQILISTAVMIAVLFLCAGRLDWAPGWIFVALYLVGIAEAAFVMRRWNPDLIEARAKVRRKDTKPFDRVFLTIYFPLTLIQPALGALDARFDWSALPGQTLWIGVALMIPCTALIAWVLGINRHAETTVRIQTDRGHKVVDVGPYRFLRHPMYIGLMLMHAATALILGSAWALVMAAGIALLFVWRTAMEDRTLRRELPGYDEFARRTRYRLFPGVW